MVKVQAEGGIAIEGTWGGDANCRYITRELSHPILDLNAGSYGTSISKPKTPVAWANRLNSGLSFEGRRV